MRLIHGTNEDLCKLLNERYIEGYRYTLFIVLDELDSNSFWNRLIFKLFTKIYKSCKYREFTT